MRKIKKILVRQTGQGKSCECFRIANDFKGIVLYFSGVCFAEKYYADMEGFSDFIIVNRDVYINDEIVPLENGKKYFFVANSAGEVPFSIEQIAMLFEKDDKNIFLEGVTDDILIILDDGYWHFQENPYRSLFLLGQTNNNVIVSVQSIDELFGEKLDEKTSKKFCKKCGWKVDQRKKNFKKRWFS